MLQSPIIHPQAYRDTMAEFAGAVHVVTTDGPAGRRGATVIAACSVSDDPPTILVCVSRKSAANDLFVENDCFALNTLGSGHEDVATAFSGVTGLDRDERFGVGEWAELATGAPVLAGALAVFDCRLIEAKEVATHRILIGRVSGLKIGERQSPLIYYRREYHRLQD